MPARFALPRSVAALIAGLAALFGFATAALAAKPETFTARFSNLAAGGYDAVAYFTEAKPVMGAVEFKTDYKGAEWRFSSAANLEKFNADPGAFAPQYGGYCAWAVAQGSTAPGNPKNWSVVAGKLYLNFNDKVQADWSKDIPGFIAKANVAWPGVLEK